MFYRRFVLPALAAVSFAILPAVASAEMTPFLGYTASCPQPSPTPPAISPVTELHNDVLTRMTSSTDGTWLVGPGDSRPIKAGDVLWVHGGFMPAGQTPPAAWVNCTTGSYRVDFFDAPMPPATISGVTSAGSGSDVSISAKASGVFFADFAVDQPGLTASAPAQTSLLTPPGGTIHMGNGNGIPLGVGVAPGGSTVHWTATIRQSTPVTLKVTGFHAAFVRPGQSVPLRYTVDRDASLVRTVVSSAGSVVRSFGVIDAIAQMTQPTGWDGLADGGAATPDGTYRMRLTATDTDGNTSSGEAPITVDGTPPVIGPVPTVIDGAHPFLIALSDAGSGVAKGTLRVDGRNGGAGTSQIGFIPTAKKAGKHAWVIEVTDKVGNVTSRKGVYDNRADVPLLRCGNRTVSRPASCSFNGVKLKSLHWTKWGKKLAKGTAKVNGKKVSVVADQPHGNCVGSSCSRGSERRVVGCIAPRRFTPAVARLALPSGAAADEPCSSVATAGPGRRSFSTFAALPAARSVPYPHRTHGWVAQLARAHDS